MVASSLSCEQNQMRRHFVPLRVTIDIAVPLFFLKKYAAISISVVSLSQT